MRRIEYPRRSIKVGFRLIGIRKGRPGYLSRLPPIAYRRLSHRSTARKKREDAKRPIWHSPISMDELKKFLGIITYSGEYNVKRLKLFWNSSKPDEPQHGLIQLAMSYDRFASIYHAFRFSDEEMLNLEKEINENIRRIWVPSNIAVVDESICPFKGRNNPHHVFIMRKPHPHGMKNWSLVDFSGYLVQFSMFRRERNDNNQTYEPTDETLLRMAAPMPPESLICADAYFGSIKAMEKLAKNGKHSLFSCNQSRPSSFFKDGTCAELQKDGDSSTLFGEITGKRNGEKIPFLVNSFQSKGRKLCTMSTVFSDAPIEKEFEILLEDDSEEAQSQYERIKEIRPEVRTKYMEIMDFVDRADQAIAAAICPNRKMHWTTAEKLWEITMLLSVNAKKIYESATGTLNIQGPTWQKMVRRTLLQLPFSEKDEHPCSTKDEKSKSCQKRRCRACSQVGKDRRTILRCPLCGPICKHCEMKDNKGMNNHMKYFSLPPSSRVVRRAYNVET